MENVNENYLTWLMGSAGLIQSSRQPFYFLLCRRLFKTQFLWVTPGDRDRAMDGMQLRIFFSEETRQNVPDGPVNVLEVLVALCMRIDEWLSGGDDGARGWFMTILHNLSLDGCTDEALMDPGSLENVDIRVERWMSRNYDENGSGGLFPLRDPPCDQRTCDLEYQLQLYLKENRQLIGIDFG